MLLYTTIMQSLYLSPLTVTYISYIQPVYIILYMLFFVVYIADIFANNRSITSLELIIIYLLLVPFYLAIPADILWKQPFIYGVAASREWFLAVSPLFIFYLFKTKRITLKEIYYAMLCLGWVYLVGFTIIAILGNPGQFMGTHPPVYVSCNSEKGGCTYRLDIIPILFACVYYFIRFIKKNEWRSAIAFLCFLSYLLFEEKKRTMELALAITLFIIFMTQLPVKKMVLYSIGIVLFLIISVSVIYLVSPNTIQNFITMYSNVLTVLSGQKAAHSSADVRIVETIEALAIIALKPISLLVGNGRISDHYNNGQYGNFTHFYPSDIDIIGAIFEYGIIGYLMVQMEYVYLFNLMWRIKEHKKNLFLKATFFFLICFFLEGGAMDCFTAGIASTPLFISFIYCFVYLEKHKERGYEVP